MIYGVLNVGSSKQGVPVYSSYIPKFAHCVSKMVR